MNPKVNFNAHSGPPSVRTLSYFYSLSFLASYFFKFHIKIILPTGLRLPCGYGFLIKWKVMYVFMNYPMLSRLVPYVWFHNVQSFQSETKFSRRLVSKSVNHPLSDVGECLISKFVATLIPLFTVACIWHPLNSKDRFTCRARRCCFKLYNTSVGCSLI